MDGLRLQRDKASSQRVGSCSECSQLSQRYEEALDQYKLIHSQWRNAVAGNDIEVAKAILVRVPPLVEAVKKAQTALEGHHRSAHTTQDQRVNSVAKDRNAGAWYPTRQKK